MLYRGIESKKFDTRMLEWNLANGIITKAEYDQHMQGLLDLTNQCEPLKLEGEDRAVRSGLTATSRDSIYGQEPSRLNGNETSPYGGSVGGGNTSGSGNPFG